MLRSHCIRAAGGLVLVPAEDEDRRQHMHTRDRSRFGPLVQLAERRSNRRSTIDSSALRCAQLQSDAEGNNKCTARRRLFFFPLHLFLSVSRCSIPSAALFHLRPAGTQHSVDGAAASAQQMQIMPKTNRERPAAAAVLHADASVNNYHF